jgi:hypothetical protein
MAKKKRPKIDPEKLANAVKKMASKAQELGWSLTQSRDASREAMENPKFVYVKLSEDQPMGGFILDWGAEKVGFGQITFYVKKKRLVCDTETMGPRFVKAAMLHFLDKSVIYDPKPSKEDML